MLLVLPIFKKSRCFHIPESDCCIWESMVVYTHVFHRHSDVTPCLITSLLVLGWWWWSRRLLWVLVLQLLGTTVVGAGGQTQPQFTFAGPLGLSWRRSGYTQQGGEDLLQGKGANVPEPGGALSQSESCPRMQCTPCWCDWFTTQEVR